MRLRRRRRGHGSDGPDVEAPGWDAIDAALAKLYPRVKPFHVAPGSGPYLGGGVQGISAYPAEGHWHLVTYGLSELYVKESSDLEESGFGYELTFRIPRREQQDRPPDWPFTLLEKVAVTQREGIDYSAGSRLHVGGPIDGEKSRLTVLAFTVDSELEQIETPNGRVEFLQLVGITEEEAELMKRSTTADSLAAMAQENPRLITDPRRSEPIR
jgi:suppressor of fused-like protein